MATLYVQNVPDDLYEALRRQAQQNRKSIAAEVVSLLELNVPTRKELNCGGIFCGKRRGCGHERVPTPVHSPLRKRCSGRTAHDDPIRDRRQRGGEMVSPALG